jgi:hypothetical protein
MKLKTKIIALAVCSALMLPTAAAAATADDTKNTPALSADLAKLLSSVSQTNVNGILVPGIYITDKDSRVAFILAGVGLVVVNKAVPLPAGSYYLN